LPKFCGDNARGTFEPVGNPTPSFTLQKISNMTPSETKAIVTLSLLAAFVDGEKHERERAEIKRIAEGLSQADGLNLPTLYQDVLMKRVSLASVAGELTSSESKQLAYEMAVCVCDADGAQSEAERMFLMDVRTSLGLDASAARFSEQAEEIAAVPVAAAAGTAVTSVASPNVPDSAELDKSILNAAILNGALELLPETLSTMAIIPLQMKLVYRIGQAHGYQLDSGHIKDFLATVGVGLTSQYLEQAGRKLLGGLLGKMARSSRIGHSGRSSPWQQWIRCCKRRLHLLHRRDDAAAPVRRRASARSCARWHWRAGGSATGPPARRSPPSRSRGRASA
jgi:tellurite resistance protein